MSLYIASLNSGSNGNCYYIGNETEAVLVDAGLSCRETEIRMKRLGLSPLKLKAIFISHEHTDHIKGVTVLSKKWSLPVYITKATLTFSRLKLEKHLVNDFTFHSDISIGNLIVNAFPKDHDAADACSFTIRNEDVRVGVFTDIGNVCDVVKREFKKCDAAFLEANYDEKMLEEGGYPWHLKQRIRGGKGHISNKQALELYLNERSPYISHLILSHLSENNNDPHLVKETFSPHAGNTLITVASRYNESANFYVTKNASASPIPFSSNRSAQLQLFGE